MTQAEQGRSRSDPALPVAPGEALATSRDPDPSESGAAGQVAADHPAWPARARHPVLTHLAVLFCYIGLGLAVTWPRISFLDGRLPRTRDAGSYVWGFWWLARSVGHLSNPWMTRYLAAPVGTQLGLHTLMPLPGLVLAPVTAAFGPSASYNLLGALLPGLLSYAMYRAARLWLSSQIAAIAAGGFFGYSVIVDFWAWNHVNLAVGALFMPLTLEAAVRLRRKPGPGQAVILGVILGASVLTDQDSALMAAMVAIAVLLPWLFSRRRPGEPGDGSIPDRVLGGRQWARLLPVALAVAVTAIVALPQLLAIRQAVTRGGPPVPPDPASYLGGITFPNIVMPSPRLASLHLPIPHSPDFTTYGIVLTVLAIAGLVVAWRQRRAWLFGLGWLGATVLAMGSSVHIGYSQYLPFAQQWHGLALSSLMPYTWLVRAPGLASFRVPARVAEIALMPAAVLAGFAVTWLRDHARPVLVPVLALAVVEAGLSTPPGLKTMPTALPALDRPIAADHSGSIVVDVPFGLRGGDNLRGEPFSPESQVLATADGHPLAVANLSRTPPATAVGIHREAFYAYLMAVQKGHPYLTPAHVRAAAANARHMDVGWVLLWQRDRAVVAFLRKTGFRFAYRADGVSVYRPAR